MQTIQITSALNDSINLIDNPWFIVNEDQIVGIYENRDQARRAKKEEGIAGKIFSRDHVILELAYLSSALPDETITEADEAELAATIDAEEDSSGVTGFETHKLTHCPHCGVHLSNGVGEHLQEVNGKQIKHKKFEYECLGCGEEFGPAICEGGKSSAETGTAHEAQKTSLKLDRTITARMEETDVVLGTWPNANQMWKANLDWMTSGQQDGLTAKLYKAAKVGEQISVIINGRIFNLVNVVGV